MPDKNEIKKRFEDIYYKTYDYIYRYLAVKVGDKQAVEDLIQSVYLKFYRRLCDDKKGSVLNPKHYILRSAKLAAAEYYRSERAETLPVEETEIVDERALERLENDYTYTFDEVMGLVESMDRVTYQIFYLHFCLDMTIEKTAAKLGLSQSTVKSKMYRALKKLRENYRKAGEVNESIGGNEKRI